jgi:hypothetical protein
MRKMLALAVMFSFAPLSFAQNIDFDQGVDMDKTVEGIHNYDYGYYPPGSYPPNSYPGYHSRYTKDCARFTFEPSEGDVKSEKVRLHSTEYIQYCYTTYTPGPNGQQIPHTHCYERPGMTWNQGAQILIKARKLYPWEREDMEVCLEGPWMNLYIDAAAYKYSVSQRGQYDVLYELTPQHKKAMNPDESGLTLTEFAYDKETKKYTFKVSDKWAEEYTGEKVMIKVELYKDGFWFFDSYKGKKEVTFDAALGYDMSFTEDELVKDNQDMDEAEKEFKSMDMKGSKKFFVKWGFKRIGKISTDKFVKKGKTEFIEQ